MAWLESPATSLKWTTWSARNDSPGAPCQSPGTSTETKSTQRADPSGRWKALVHCDYTSVSVLERKRDITYLVVNGILYTTVSGEEHIVWGLTGFESRW
jgi:hypothetical protein